MPLSALRNRRLEGSEILAQVTRWMGLVAGCLTILLWCFVIPSCRATLVVGASFLEDANKETWRNRMFSFSPSVFVDVWTPFVFGALSVLCQCDAFDIRLITKDFFRFALWNTTMALFANLGYVGCLGFAVGGVTLLTSFFAVMSALTCEGKASLGLQPFRKTESLQF